MTLDGGKDNPELGMGDILSFRDTQIAALGIALGCRQALDDG